MPSLPVLKWINTIQVYIAIGKAIKSQMFSSLIKSGLLGESAAQLNKFSQVIRQYSDNDR